MSRAVERKCPPHDLVLRYFPQLAVVGLGIGARMHREHERLPTLRRQVLRKLQRSLDSAAAEYRRIVIGNHQHALGHEFTQSIVQRAT